MDYILAGLFVSVLVFEYYQTRQFMGTIKHLVQVISELKSFALGAPEEEEEERRYPPPPSHEDFGMGRIIEAVEKAEEGGE